jgi:hypothetical protein
MAIRGPYTRLQWKALRGILALEHVNLASMALNLLDRSG